MSRKLFSQSFLRGIFEETRKTRMLMSSHRPPLSPASEIRSISMFHLPDVQAPAQYLIGMGIRPALARHLSNIYMDSVTRYRQVFESYFRRAIQGNCDLHPEHYRDIFVVQFRGTIQVLESQFMSATSVWPCQAGLPTLFSLRGIDVRVDAATKAQILSRLGLDTASFIMDKAVNKIELPEEERATEGNPATKMFSASTRLLEPNTPSTLDFFSSEKSSSCFPERYPPPLSKPISSQKTLLTQFFTTTSAKTEKLYAKCKVDMSPLTTLFGRMSVTTPEVAFKAQENRKCSWDPRSKKLEPLPPLLSSVVAGVSGSPQKLQAPGTGGILSEKSNTAPRRRRIAALPTRQTKTTALPSLDPSSHPATNPPVLAPASNNIMTRTPLSRVAKTMATEETSVDYVISSPGAVQNGPPPQPWHITRTPDILGSKADSSGRRKRLPLPRRVASQLQTTVSQRQVSAQLTPSGLRTPLSTALRTPSLVSDMSSSSDSLSSSDEFDTPPSTPPEHSYDLTAHNPLATSLLSRRNPTQQDPFGGP